MAKTASPSPTHSLSEAHAPGNDSNPLRTFHGLVIDKKLTVRRLCSELKVAAESLRAAYDEPGRLSLNAVVALSELVGEDPTKIATDLLNEIGELRKKGPAPAAPKRSRTLKPKNKTHEHEGN